jgi:hypothetical protein
VSALDNYPTREVRGSLFYTADELRFPDNLLAEGMLNAVLDSAGAIQQALEILDKMDRQTASYYRELLAEAGLLPEEQS